MPLREGEEQVRVHLWLYASDLEWIKDTYGDTLGVSKPVRLMVRKFRQNAQARASQGTPAGALREAINDAE